MHCYIHGLHCALLLQDNVEAIAKVSKNFNEKIRKCCDMTVLSCAHAGTGNVLKVQSCDEIVLNFFFKTELLLHLSMFIIADCGCIFYFNMLLVLLSCRFKICWVIVHNILIKVKLAKVLLCLELLW